MATHTGILAGSEVLGTLPSTVFADSIAIDISPYTAWVPIAVLKGVAAAGTDYLDVDSFTGITSPDFADLWYNHFHILPNRINLGNLTSQQIRSIELFNGYFTDLELSSIAATDLSGVSFGLVTPETLAPLESIFRNLTIDTEGTPNFDGFFEISADDGGTYFLYVTGQRVLVMPFQHNWQDNVVERLAWLNGGAKALDGTEQIVMLRNKPRRSLDYQFLLASSQTNAARLQALFAGLMFGWQSRVFVVPIWTDATRLQTDAAAGQQIINVPTTYFDYDVGAYVMLWQDEEHYEVVEIQAVNPTSLTATVNLVNTWAAARTVVMPARLAYITQNIQGTKYTYDIQTAPVSFELLPQYISQNRLVPGALTMYRTYPVLTVKNNHANTAAFSVESNSVRNDSNVGIFSLDRVQPTPEGANSFSFLFADHAQVAAFYSWLDDRKGRVGVFWYPTWSHDMQLTADIGAAATAFVINSIEYSSLYYVNGAPAYSRRDVMIRLKNGTTFYRRIQGVTLDTTTGLETVSIDTALGQIVHVSDIDRISFLIPSALKADAVEIAWESGNVSQSQIVVADVYNANI
jgi:hypothetical protein